MGDGKFSGKFRRATNVRIHLERITKADAELQALMLRHYSKPKGFVGRQLHYAVSVGGVRYGAICAGSATLHLPGRGEFLGAQRLNCIVNNTFFHIEGPYPLRNFAQQCVAAWRLRVLVDWQNQYGDRVGGFETLVELPRRGDVYLRDGWTEVGLTKGFVCKRVAGRSSDGWGGRRVWGVGAQKRVFCRRVSEEELHDS